MQYGRSYSIEKRLQDVLELARAGRYSAQEMAERVGVSVPTISRDITALRERGYPVLAARRGNTWCYVLPKHAQPESRPAQSREAVRV
jgi:predicted DNA-binding transcriptional regulator YafY